jgi:2-succinyl-6-hydroxy-2,4-cyclohexadiene-1-carboxylate synthase
MPSSHPISSWRAGDNEWMRTILVPGFTQTAASWDPIRSRLRSIREVEPLDVPTGLDFAATAAAIGDAGGPGLYVGYSMGGRLCLQLAVDRPDVVQALVLVSASPGIEDAAERQARRTADEELAQTIERDGVDLFLERWLAQPLFATLPPDRSGFEARRAGSSVASLTHALRALGQGTQPPLWDRLSELEMPVVPVAGARDEKYVAIAERMADAVRTSAVVVADAGHALHLEQPDVFATMLRSTHHELTA